MKYTRRFKDEYIVNFNGEYFMINDAPHLIYGTTGVDIENDTIQIRDDLYIKQAGTDFPFSFDKMIKMWDTINKSLIVVIKKRNMLHKRTGKKV